MSEQICRKCYGINDRTCMKPQGHEGKCGPRGIEPFKIPVGRTVKMFRHKVKRPRITGFRVEGNKLIALLSCGHEKVYCRVPKWSRCYTCPVETLHWEEPTQGYKEIPVVNETPQ